MSLSEYPAPVMAREMNNLQSFVVIGGGGVVVIIFAS